MRIDEMPAGREMDKYCSGCGRELPVEKFNKNKRSKDGYDWHCKECKRVSAQKYIHSEKGKETRKQYNDQYRLTYKDRRRELRAAYANDNPEKIRARWLWGNAVRKGYVPKPSNDRTWQNKYEFHHPDYSRPYYGVYVSTTEHKAIEAGKTSCPPCTDYTKQVINGICKDWGLNRAALKAMGVTEV